MIVGAQDQETIFDRDDDDQRPDDQRRYADRGSAGSEVAMRPRRYRDPEGVERARADVAIDDTERGEG
jgi:hypothetical protein